MTLMLIAFSPVCTLCCLKVLHKYAVHSGLGFIVFVVVGDLKAKTLCIAQAKISIRLVFSGHILQPGWVSCLYLLYISF